MVGVVAVEDAEEVKFLVPILLIYLSGVYLHILRDFSCSRLIEICTHLCQGFCNTQMTFEQYMPYLSRPPEPLLSDARHLRCGIRIVHFDSNTRVLKISPSAFSSSWN